MNALAISDPVSVTRLQIRILDLEAQLSEREQAQQELTSLYDAQSAYLDRHLVSWCQTPFARRIAELEAELGY
jgi:hypothetical protein